MYICVCDVCVIYTSSMNMHTCVFQMYFIFGGFLASLLPEMVKNGPKMSNIEWQKSGKNTLKMGQNLQRGVSMWLETSEKPCICTKHVQNKLLFACAKGMDPHIPIPKNTGGVEICMLQMSNEKNSVTHGITNKFFLAHIDSQKYVNTHQFNVMPKKIQKKMIYIQSGEVW